jgi:hypothetical protein
MALSGFISTSFPTDLIGTFNEAANTISSAPAQTIIKYALKNTDFTPIPGHPNSTPPGHRFTGADLGYRHFTFILRSNLGETIFEQLVLNINPEDFSVDEPYRVNAINTMGGAFVDVWGNGIRRILMRGHTGWRTYTGMGQVQDGYDNLFNLRDRIINAYLQIRIDKAINYPQSRIEDGLTLEIVDHLHQTIYNVVPENFRLLRNKARPLLHMYEASFIIRDLKPNQDAGVNPLTGKTDAGVAHQMDSLGGQFQGLKDRLGDLGGPFADALHTILDSGNSITGTFKDILKAKGEFTQGVEGIRALAADATQAIDRGLGALQSYIDLSGIALDVKSLIYDTKSVYGNLRCLLNEVKAKGLYVYTGMVSSATCAGLYGQPVSPLVDVPNTFDTITQTQQQTIIGQSTTSISGAAQSAAAKVQSLDIPIILANGGV